MTSIRVCKEHLYPVGLVQDSLPFVCLLKYEQLSIDGTRIIETDAKLIVKLVTSRTDCIQKAKAKHA